MWLRTLMSWWFRFGQTHMLRVGDLNRTYVVHFPWNRDRQMPLPVVLVLHGATMNGPMMAWFSGLNRKADEAGFIAVYPDGTGRRSAFFWNGGNCCGEAMREKVDDVGFINALLDELMRNYSVDPRRVYATGISNGAIMVYRLAAELPERFAAIASVAGSVGTEIGQIKHPMSILHFHGTLDEFIPFTGGWGTKSISATNHRSVDESIGAWVKANGCNEIPRTDVLSEGNDGMKVIRRTYDGGSGGTEVALVVIEGGGHTWPGKKPPATFLGPSTLNISANNLIWEFFQKHPQKSREQQK